MDRKRLETLVNAREDEIHEIRQSIENFRITVLADVLNGTTLLSDLYPRFRAMHPSLHRCCNDPRQVDFKALTYALQRLPREVTRTQRIFIQKEPETRGDIPGVRPILAQMRRRSMYDIGGDLEFIALEGETDIFDILTCLVMYGIEAGKIKANVAARGEIDLSVDGTEKKNRVFARLANVCNARYEDLTKANDGLNGNLIQIIQNILCHMPERIIIEYDSEFAKTDDSKKARLWVSRIMEVLKEYGKRPLALISSDTHSAVNCLSGFAMINRDRILRLSDCPQGLDLSNDSTIYYLLQKLCKMPEHKDLLDERIVHEKGLGIRVIRDVYNTGVDAQIIDIAQIIRANPGGVDSRVRYSRAVIEKGLLVLNMDYSFGRQGAHNMRNLCEKLGKNIESISITGKAGITCGEKYDIMLPTYIVPQIIGGIFEFPVKNGLRKNDIMRLVEGEVQDHGPMLTVPGTAMQSDLLFFYYMLHDNIIGVEMEAGPYIDAIEKAYKRGQLRKDFRLNVGYWASDNPFKESLAEDHMDGGCVPSYALMIGILNRILG